MHLKAESDYAIRMMAALAAENRRISAHIIAQRTGVTPRFALKILRKLVGAGLVASHKGAGGGYELKVDPKEVSLLDVIQTVEGTYTINRCLLDEGFCNYDHGDEQCKVQKQFERVNDLICEQLSSITFADLI